MKEVMILKLHMEYNLDRYIKEMARNLDVPIYMFILDSKPSDE